jgi:D-alanyl-D-alanine carboxypeptidase/D-alanyl-D-alanine-endopeptidase (penicillin-binding protein 4)
MQKLFFILGLFFTSLLQAAELPESVAQALKQVRVPKEAVGIFVQPVGENKPLLEFNSDQVMNPASTIKLITTYAALELLGPAYTWKTEAYADGPIDGDVLDGDLILKGYGDPKLTLENFWLLLRNIREHGVREIRGDLIIDRSRFNLDDHDPNKFDADPIRAYNVGPDAFLLNFKAVRFDFIPDAENKKVTIVTEPQFHNLVVENKLKLVTGDCGDWSPRRFITFQVRNNKAKAIFKGSYHLGCGDKSWYIGFEDHTTYTHELFKQLWKELGGTIIGRNVHEGKVSEKSKLIGSMESPALAELIRDVNKYSNNVMARQIFLTIGAEATGLPANPDYSIMAVKNWLQKKGLNFPELVLENGAGLSRVERITPRHMGELLINAYASPVMPELISSLPIIAVDGTMKKRLLGLPIAGQGHIKTGRLEQVSAIAGYMLDKRGQRYVVVCIINHAHSGNGTQVVHDALLDWLYNREVVTNLESVSSR